MDHVQRLTSRTFALDFDGCLHEFLATINASDFVFRAHSPVGVLESPLAVRGFEESALSGSRPERDRFRQLALPELLLNCYTAIFTIRNAFLIVEQESTFTFNTSPAANAVVQPVSTLLVAWSALERVGFALAVIVSAAVGG